MTSSKFLLFCLLLAILAASPTLAASRRRQQPAEQQQEAAVDDTSNNGGDSEVDVVVNSNNDQSGSAGLQDRNNNASPTPDSTNVPDPQPQQQQSEEEKIKIKVNKRNKIRESAPDKVETILDLDFARDFSHFNPRDDASVFQWSSVDLANSDKVRRTEINSVAGVQDDGSEEAAAAANGRLRLVADNAAFLRSDDGILSMSSTPFDRWLPQSAGINASQAIYDAAAVIKQPVKVGKNQILRVMLRFRCETFNTGQHKFGEKAVTSALDDPRLASCGLYLTDDDITGIELGIILTNKGIWAVYNNQEWFRAAINGNYRAYNIYRRLTNRANVDDLLEARIEVDRALKETRYYVNNQLLWRVEGGWGAPSIALLEQDQTRLVSMSDGQLLPVMPKSYSVYVVNGHKMDVADPNNAHVLGEENKALVRYVSAKDYYGANLLFWESANKRRSSLYGQSAKAGLKRMLIERVIAAEPVSDTQA